MSYEITYNSNLTKEQLISSLIISLIFLVFEIIVMWKLFKKAGKPGWAAIVPFYNLYIFFQITWGNGWLFLLTLLSIIPVVGPLAVLVIMIITMVKLAKVFGKSNGFAVGLVFLSTIFEAILAFGSSKYIGVNGVSAEEPKNIEDPVQPMVEPTVEPNDQPTVEPMAEPTEEQPVVGSEQSDENDNN